MENDTIFNWDAIFQDWDVSKESISILMAEYTLRKNNEYFTITFFVQHGINGNCLETYGLNNLTVDAGRSLYNYCMSKHQRKKRESQFNSIYKLQELGVLPK